MPALALSADDTMNNHNEQRLLTHRGHEREQRSEYHLRLILEIFSPVEISLINKYSGSYISSRSVHKINLEYCGIVN